MEVKANVGREGLGMFYDGNGRSEEISKEKAKELGGATWQKGVGPRK